MPVEPSVMAPSRLYAIAGRARVGVGDLVGSAWKRWYTPPMSAPVALPGVYRLTYRDWLGFSDDGRQYELLDGELIMTPPPSVDHQRISRQLETHLLAYLMRSKAGELLHAPVGVRLGDEDVVEPDIVVVLTEHADRIGTQVIEGAPDLVVEILSPGSARRDLGVKREKYETYGVAEYWIVDPASHSIEVLSQRAGSFERTGLFGLADMLHSPLFADLEIPLADVFVTK
jgi:Uma2 family endonuclease